MPIDYYTLYKTSKDPTVLRKEIVAYALTHDIKGAVKEFKTSAKTVRKWVNRWKTEHKKKDYPFGQPLF